MDCSNYIVVMRNWNHALVWNMAIHFSELAEGDSNLKTTWWSNDKTIIEVGYWLLKIS